MGTYSTTLYIIVHVDFAGLLVHKEINDTVVRTLWNLHTLCSKLYDENIFFLFYSSIQYLNLVF